MAAAAYLSLLKTHQQREYQCTMESTWTNYSKSCICGNSYDGRNAAHFLSNALILGGFSALDGGNGRDKRIVNKFCVCTRGRPIRAIELRDWFKENWKEHSSPPRDGLALVFQQKPAGFLGLRHEQTVVLKRYKDGRCVGYKGSTDYPNWQTQKYYY